MSDLGMVMPERLNFDQLRQYALQAGFQGDAANTIAATALAESGGNPYAHGDVNLGNSYGVTQINEKAHGPIAKSALGDPLQAMKLAFQVSNGGQDFSPWTMYRNGTYKQYLGVGNQAPSKTDSGLTFGELGAPTGGTPIAPPQGTLAQGTKPGPDMAAIGSAVSRSASAMSPWQRLMTLSMIQQLTSQGTHQFVPVQYDPWKGVPAAAPSPLRVIVGSKGEPIGYV